MGRSEEAQAEVEALADLQKTLADAKNLYWAGQVGIERTMASAWLARALGHDDQAVALMQDAARAEESSETHDTLSPGPVGMTAHEALGYLLLGLKRPAEAFQAFEASLRISKNRLQSYAGAANAAASAGDRDDARTYYGKLVELTAGSDGARPEIAEAKTFIEVGK
jgi:tetratricopeptide (TPR) repeat protein